MDRIEKGFAAIKADPAKSEAIAININIEMSCCEKSSIRFIQINNFLYNIFKDTIIIKTKKNPNKLKSSLGKKMLFI